MATAPDDAVFALGSENRVLMIAPSRRLILVRLGQNAPDPLLREQLAARVMAAMGAMGAMGATGATGAIGSGAPA